MKQSEFARRREQLMQMVGEDGVVILPAAPVRMRSRDVEYRYRQDSDFYYLTGFAEPDAVAVLVPGRSNGEFLLFCRERDPEKELWNGHRAGQDGAIQDFAADDAFPIDDIDDILPGVIESCRRVYYTMGMYKDFDSRIGEWINSLRARESRGVHTPHEFVALDHLLHDMRLFKSRAEIAAMRKSAKVAVAAHERAMQQVRPGLMEYEVAAEFHYEFKRHNACVSYNPIVGSGANSCTLHYVDNNKQLEDHDLLLIDAGCELDYYASDITRTLPVNGKFSPEQRAVYEIVLEAQLVAIEKTRKGNHWNEPHDAAVDIQTVLVGIELGGVGEVGLRRVEVAHFAVGQPAQHVNIDEVLARADRGVEAGDRLGPVLEPEVGDAEIILCPKMIRRLAQRLLKLAYRLGVILIAIMKVADHHVIVGVGRLDRLGPLSLDPRRRRVA